MDWVLVIENILVLISVWYVYSLHKKKVDDL